MKTLTELNLRGLYRAAKDSHKGMNGRLLVIGGSKLFHSSIFWAAEVASKIVDLVHFSSPAMENNEIVRKKAKAGFWNGIVVPWEKVEEYIREDDCILIGPGMVRPEGSQVQNLKFKVQNLQQAAQVDDTKTIVDTLLKKYPRKRWVVDGGALQECNPKFLNENMIITPHAREFDRLVKNSKLHARGRAGKIKSDNSKLKIVQNFSKSYDGVTVLLKGVRDIVCQRKKSEEIEGGNEGMTKGGTGDVLAGLVAALYCKNEAFLAAKAGSLINKRAGDSLYKRVGPYFNASDLVREVAEVLASLIR